MGKINEKHARFINWMPPFMEVLKEKGGSATPKEVKEAIAVKMELDESFLSERLKSGQFRFDNQANWAGQFLAWEKLIDKSKRGVWTLTEKGHDIQLDYDAALEVVKKWQKFHRDNRVKSKIETVAKEELEAETDTELSLLDILKQTSPEGFEHVCGRLLREYGFEDITITQKSNDKGIDGTATLKINPFLHMSVFFQCKRYDGTVPISHVREFVGVLATERSGVDRGILITTGTFSKEAYEIERKSTNLELIDGEKLVEMFEKAKIGVTPRTVYDPDMAFFAQYTK